MTASLVRGRDARASLPASPLVLASGRQHSAESVMRAWFASKSAPTIAAYESDLEELGLFVSRALRIVPPLKVTDALSWLFQQSAASANETALHFRTHLQNSGMAPSTVNRHLATLRSVTALGRMLGALAWQIEIPGLKAEKRKDTRGPDAATVRRLLDAIDTTTEQGARDAALIRLLYSMALRVAEVCRLDVADLDVPRGQLWVLGKGRREKVLLKVPDAAVEAVSLYLRHRGSTPGPLFLSLGHRGGNRDHRLETRSVLRIVRTAGARVGIKLWCHALRHASITVAIEKGQQAGIGLDQIRHFSRHKAVATMMLYRDERDQAKTQAQLAAIVDEELRR